jgi:hypothetical protein
MNERIKELWSQAGGHYDSGNQHTWPQYTIDDPEKFAMLIVAECAALAKSKSEYIQSMETNDRGDQMQIQSLAWQFEEFGYKIKKHFGVEE